MIKYFTLLALLIAFLTVGCEPADATAEKENGAAVDNGTKDLPAAVDNEKAKKKNIVFFGNSLTAAYGLDPSEGFADLIQQKLDSLNLNYRTINAGLSGETTAGGLSRVNWILERNKVAVFVLELGGNDGLRGLDPDDSKKNLQGIIDKVKASYPDAAILLAGMEAPPNMGQSYTSKFRKMYQELADENDLTLIPFLLEGVGGIPELNQRDGIHPTAEGHRIVAENIWRELTGLLDNSATSK